MSETTDLTEAQLSNESLDRLDRLYAAATRKDIYQYPNYCDFVQALYFDFRLLLSMARRTLTAEKQCDDLLAVVEQRQFLFHNSQQDCICTEILSLDFTPPLPGIMQIDPNCPVHGEN